MVKSALAGEYKHVSMQDRWLIMGLAGRLLWSNEKIIRTMKWVGQEACRVWAARGRSGREHADDDQRSGAPLKITGKHARRLRAAIQNKRFVHLSSLARKMGVCKQTLLSTAHRMKLKPVKVRWRCRQSEKQKQYRLDWCKARISKGLDYWRTWVWSDEKWFYMVCKQSGEWVWVAEDDLENEARYVPKDKHPTKVMVWAAMSYEGKSSIHIFDDSIKVNSAEYQKCIEEALLPSLSDPDYLFPGGQPRSWIFMQDGAPVHTSKSTKFWLAQHLPAGCSINDGIKWPSASPDLNPIENLWIFFQNAVVERDPKSFQDFQDTIIDVWWNGITQAYIQNLYHSMNRRCQAVINASGQMTKY